MFRKLLAASVFAALTTVALPAVADDPSLHDIYAAAEAGRFDEAQTMIGKVLADHPDSAKAHYVAAELDARQGRLDAARGQLAQAEKLSPGLAFAKPDSVRALRAQLGVGGSAPVRSTAVSPVRNGGDGHSSLMTFGVIALVIFVLYMIFRRRPAAPSAQVGGAPNPYYGGSGAPGYGAPPAGGGIGSGIAGGLASGLAVGAGVVAGEAIAHRLMGDGEHGSERYAGSADTRGDSDANAGMGGNDFGVSDSGSWDDSSGGGVSDSGGGSDDWS